MQILVISDTHGRLNVLRSLVQSHPDADLIVHCGDGEYEAGVLLDAQPSLRGRFLFVRGNCDRNTHYPLLLTHDLPFGHRLVMTHGHNYMAGDLRENLLRLAKSVSADLVLFGHLHVRIDETAEGVRIFNPGSAAKPRDGRAPSFGLIDIFESGILTSHGTLPPSPYSM